MAGQVGGMEAEQEVLANYKLELDELTSNDIDDIKRLTIIAKDKDEMPEPRRFAKAVVDTICSHILEAPKELKMPPLYLLDSIAKNVGGDYVNFISSRLVEVFVQAFNQADSRMRTVMEHLYKTWLNQKTFNPNLLSAIERQVGFPPSSTAPPDNHHLQAPAVHSSGDSPSTLRSTGGIHVNPVFLHQGGPGRGRGFMGLPSQDVIGWRQAGAPPNLVVEGKELHGLSAGRGFPRPIGRGEGRGFPPGMVTPDRNGSFPGVREPLANGENAFGRGRGPPHPWAMKGEESKRPIEDFETRVRAFARGQRMQNGFGHPMEDAPGRLGQVMGRSGPWGRGDGFWKPAEEEEMAEYSFEAELSQRIDGGRMGWHSMHGATVGMPMDMRRERQASPPPPPPPLGRIIDAAPLADSDDKPEVPDWIKERKAKLAVPDWLKEKTAKVKATLAREAWEERAAGIEEEWSDGEDFGRRALPAAAAAGPRMVAPPPPPGPPPGLPQGGGGGPPFVVPAGPGAQAAPPPPLGPPPGAINAPPSRPPVVDVLPRTGQQQLGLPPTSSLFPPQPSAPPPMPQGPPPAGAHPTPPPKKVPQPTLSRPLGLGLLPPALPSQRLALTDAPPLTVPAQLPHPTSIESAPAKAMGSSATTVIQQQVAGAPSVVVSSESLSEAGPADRRQPAAASPQTSSSQQVSQNLLQQLLQQATQLVASSAAAKQSPSPLSSSSAAPPPPPPPPTAIQANTLAALLQLIPPVAAPAAAQLPPPPAPPLSTTSQASSLAQAAPPAPVLPPQNGVVPPATVPAAAQPQTQPVLTAPTAIHPPLLQPPLPPGPPPAQARVPSPLTVPRPPAIPTPPPVVLAVAPGSTPAPSLSPLSTSSTSAAPPPAPSALGSTPPPPLPPGAPPLATILASVVPSPPPITSTTTTTAASAPPPSVPPAAAPIPATSGPTTSSAPLTNILTQDLLSSLVSYGLITAPGVSNASTTAPSSTAAATAATSITPSVSPPPQALPQLSAPLPAHPAPPTLAGPPPQQPVGAAPPPSASMGRPTAMMMPMQGHPMPGMPPMPSPGMPVMNGGGLGMHPQMGMAHMGGVPMPGMYPMQPMPPYQPNHSGHSHMPMVGQPLQQHYMPHHHRMPQAGMRPMPAYGGAPMRGQPAPPPGLPGMHIMGGPHQRPALMPSRETTEVGMEFKMEELRVRHESVIRALYTDFSHHCKSCGRRFHTQAEHAQHLDWHFKQNQKRKAQKTTSRRWFVSVEEWLSGTGARSTEAAPSFFADLVTSKPKKEEEDKTAVPADESQKECPLCGEEFEVFFSADADEWMYKGTVYLKAATGSVVPAENIDRDSLGPIVHAKCRSLDVTAEGRQDGAGVVEEQKVSNNNNNSRGGETTQRGLNEQGHAGNGPRKKEPREEEELSDFRRKRTRF